MSVLLGCATPYSKLTIDERKLLFDQFTIGDAELACSLSDGFAVALGWRANAVDRQAEFHESGQWSKLAVDVMSVGFGGDKEWFFLGRAAEGLGHLSAAKKYYEASLSKGFLCKCLGSQMCTGLNFPEIVTQRLHAVESSEQGIVNWSDYEQARFGELELQSHVSFYQCKRWARGKSTEALRAFMAALAAGAAAGIVAGEIAGSGSIGENAALGAAIGLSAEATASIYRGIRFPESEYRGKDFAYLFDECMETNGLYTDGDRLDFTSWAFTDDEAVFRVGLRGKILLIKEITVDSCRIQLQYFNQHTEITNLTIEITLFDSGKQSLSEHVVPYPSVFPSRSHLAELEVSEVVCNLANMGYVSSAVDQVSSRDISELKGSRIFTCSSTAAECQISGAENFR